ncbi:PLP-dependent aminotransferase family protein [Corticibacter populi]|uniref:PLP-dependent aminotransferase family protein n=1 Tax=Corticibacter populi TaxID=1550736 RepID=A0A3M6QI53_9BURK|nr:PLP-dependent aminotransferase family protein [Corticibacter populi]RMX02615.1 PLP-dependent aminotransferase family protein [Corticibacter populi]RZS32970.1 GntR family transcriptional regulator [Corticibacter populi]
MPARDDYLYRRIAGHYHSAIRTRQLLPGQALPSIRAIMQAQNVSMATAVKSVHLLEAQGLVECRPRHGYFVRKPVAAPTLEPAAIAGPLSVRGDCYTGIGERISTLVEKARRSPIRVDLAIATPPAELFDAQGIRRLAIQILKEQPELLVTGRSVQRDESAFQHAVAGHAARHGMHIPPERILSTTGNSEAITLALSAICTPGDWVAVESPTFYGHLQIIESLHLRALEIPCEPGTGMSLPALQLALDTHPQIKAVVVTPNMQMPTGATMPADRRRQLAQLAATRGLAIVEDDSYGLLAMPERYVAPIQSWDERGHVIYCESFNKPLLPGLRQGWLHGGQWHNRIAMFKTAQSRFTQPFGQVMSSRYLLEQPRQRRHLARLRETLRQRSEAMARLIRRSFPAGTDFVLGDASLSLWLRLPAADPQGRLFDLALAKGIRIAPGSMFSHTQHYDQYLRLSCVQRITPEIEWACRELGRLVAAL